jgi:ABC-type branched-subunit amino acid transport system ATPase component
MSVSILMPLTSNRAQGGSQGREALAVSGPPVLLRAEGLKKGFGGHVVLDGLDLELRQGEVVLLRGENGSGKTTLLNVLTGNLEPDAGAIHYLVDGTPLIYRFPRRWWQALNPFDHFAPEFVAREGVGRTWQDIRLFGSQTLRENIAGAALGRFGHNPALALFAPPSRRRREVAVAREADAVLARLGLMGREESSADKISVGQSKRVAIARAVAAGARILFLDEPLAGLDRRGINDVLELLGSLVGEQDITLVIVEHVFNQTHLQGLVTTDWLLAGGTIKRADCTAGKDNSAVDFQVTSTDSLAQHPAWFGLVAGEGATVLDEPLPRGALLTRVRRPGVFQIPPKRGR